MLRLLTLTALALVPVALAAAPAAHADTARSVPDPLYGITYDRVDKTSRIVDANSHLSKMPTSRIVFDEFVPAKEYAAAVKAIRPTSYVMGELLDSYYMKQYSLAAFDKRAKEYMDALGTDVDIWEIGNEVNGEWLGTTSATVSKISASFDAAKARGYRTALTLYYNPNCWSKKSNEMFAWSQANIPARIKAGADYVFVSYYEQDCENYRPSVAQWQTVFDRLHTMFPNSKLGFGEVGTHPKSTVAYKTDYLQRYYGMPITTPGFVGGNFWWYGYQDPTPWSTQPLWKTLDAELRTY